MKGRSVECELCYRSCVIPPGGRGNCRVRYNLDGELVSLVYGKPCAVHVDPIEKKPLYHFIPGSRIFSIATAGCNGHCMYCQNWEISQRNPEETNNVDLPPAEVVAQSVRHSCPSIAYTYTDPNIFYEYAYDSSKLAKKRGLKNVLVTAGILNEKPLRKLAKYVDAANIDFKGNAKFYKEVVGARIEPVQRFIKVAIEEGIFVELTNLIVPTLNDKREDFRFIIKWILDELGPDVPLHFSRFHPMYKLTNLYPTPAETMLEAANMARDMGIRYVYIGNMFGLGFEDTQCPKCNEVVIKRHGFRRPDVFMKNGRCAKCKTKIPGVWR